jgi:hypothetical protein
MTIKAAAASAMDPIAVQTTKDTICSKVPIGTNPLASTFSGLGQSLGGQPGPGDARTDLLERDVA